MTHFNICGKKKVFELMEKGSLLKFIRENPVSFEDCVGMMIESCRGMVYLSDKKIVHRDLAARNILVREHTLSLFLSFSFS
jgi:serine/threonine protein kinase